MTCVRFIISGRVQGVFFRASTRERAQRLKLSGYAKNMLDGSVEVLACGDEVAIDLLEHWLQHGPPSARVDGVVRMPADALGTEGFGMC